MPNPVSPFLPGVLENNTTATVARGRGRNRHLSEDLWAETDKRENKQTKKGTFFPLYTLQSQGSGKISQVPRRTQWTEAEEPPQKRVPFVQMWAMQCGEKKVVCLRSRRK